jgi:glucose-6-phosphate isomerase
LGSSTIGGRYSALSVFGLVPAALMGVDLERLLERVEEMVDACHAQDGNPGLELGLELGEGWQDGRDKVTINPNTGGFGNWAEQLLAESTGKEGKGLIPAPGEPPDGPDRQAPEVRLTAPYELGQEFYRWEFATAVAGSILGINPFDQPDVQAAKDKTREVLARGGDPALEPSGSLE